MISRFLYIATSGVIVAGCASSPGEDLPPFGSTLRSTIQAQTWHKGDAAPTLNGDKAAGDMEAYRKQDATRPASADGVSVEMDGN